MKTFFKKTIIYLIQAEARLVLKRYHPKIVTITGSVGKTSTKDAVFAVFKGISYVRKSEKSFNSEVGLPLTILGCPNGWNNPTIWLKNILIGLKLILLPNKYPEWLILEVGVGHPGDMKKTAAWLKSDVVIMTAIGETPSHIEFFSSRKHLIDEKAGLIKTLRKDGLLVLNADDEAILEMMNRTKNRVITYGFSEGADIKGSGDNIFYDENNFPKGVIYRVDEGGKSFPVIIEGVFGKNHVYASLGALAVSSGLKLNLLEAIDRLKNYDVPPGRMRLLSGIKSSLIVDDTYNSSPFACEAGLKTIGDVKNMNRKIAVLGDMLELGKHTKGAHEKIGEIARENVDYLITVGQRAVSIKEGATSAGMDSEKIIEFGNSIEAGKYLHDFVSEKDLVFIKGSQGMRMERAVEAILLDQEHKEDLLVRQDKEWLSKK